MESARENGTGTWGKDVRPYVDPKARKPLVRPDDTAEGFPPMEEAARRPAGPCGKACVGKTREEPPNPGMTGGAGGPSNNGLPPSTGARMDMIDGHTMTWICAMMRDGTRRTMRSTRMHVFGIGPKIHRHTMEEIQPCSRWPPEAEHRPGLPMVADTGMERAMMPI